MNFLFEFSFCATAKFSGVLFQHSRKSHRRRNVIQGKEGQKVMQYFSLLFSRNVTFHKLASSIDFIDFSVS